MSESTKNDAPFDATLIATPAENALAAVEAAGARAPALIDAWVRAGNAAAVALVAERGSGPARKAARRGLQVLGARGVRVEAPPRVASLAPALAETTTEAWLVPPDPAGTVLIVLATRPAASRARSAFFYVRGGLIERVNVGELSGKSLKEALKRASAMGLEPARISAAYARQRITETRDRHVGRGLPLPLGMTSAADLLVPLPDSPEPHPLDTEGLELSDEDARELSQRSAALHQLPEFRAWFPEPPEVERMLAEVGEKLGPEVSPESEESRAAFTAAIEAATDRYFTPERRTGLVQLMKDSALSVLATEGEARALEVVATMRCIESAGLITDPPHAIPFLRAFFEKAILALAARRGGRVSVPASRAPSEPSQAPAPEAAR